MRKIPTYLLLGLFLFQIGLKLYVELDYLVNQTTIIEQLCENKGQPEMQCNGKCYLKKQFTKLDESKDNSEKEVPKLLKHREFFENVTHLNQHVFILKEGAEKSRFYGDFYSVLFVHQIDYPPQRA